MHSFFENIFASDARFQSLDDVIGYLRPDDFPFVTENDLLALVDPIEAVKYYLFKVLIRKHLRPLLGTALVVEPPKVKSVSDVSPSDAEADEKPVQTGDTELELLKVLGIQKNLLSFLGTTLNAEQPPAKKAKTVSDEPKPVEAKPVRDPQPGDARLELDGVLFNDRGQDVTFLSDCGPDLKGVSGRGKQFDPKFTPEKWVESVKTVRDNGVEVPEPMLVVPKGQRVCDLDYALELLPFSDPELQHIVFNNLADSYNSDETVMVLHKIVGAIEAGIADRKNGSGRPFRSIRFVNCRLDTFRLNALKELAKYVDLIVTPDHQWNISKLTSQDVDWFSRVIWLDSTKAIMPGFKNALEVFAGEEGAEKVVEAHKIYYSPSSVRIFI